MNYLVKILSDDSGEPRFKKKWCLIQNITGEATLCEGEFFGSGESGCTYKKKQLNAEV